MAEEKSLRLDGAVFIADLAWDPEGVFGEGEVFFNFLGWDESL